MARFVPIADAPTLDAAEALLAEGFSQPRDFFATALRRSQPPSAPHRGVLLEAGAGFQGVLLAIFSEQELEGRVRLVCNLAAWYIRDPFRTQAVWMLKSAMAANDTLYTAYSPNASVQRILPLLGFRPMKCRHVRSLPLMNLASRDPAIRALRWRDGRGSGLGEADIRAAREHDRPGYLSLRLQGPQRQSTVALKLRLNRTWRVPIRTADVLYCGDYGMLRGAIEAVHRTLAWRGVLPISSHWPDGVDAVEGKQTEQAFFVKGTECPAYVQPVYSELSYLRI